MPFRRLLAARGLTQSDLSRLLGVSRQAVSLWVHGRARPHPSRILEIATALGVSPVQVRRSLSLVL